MTSLRSELIIDPTIVQENINYLKKLIPVGSKFMAVIKSDAYGHIMENLLEHIDDFVDGYGTVRIDEAIRIREASNKKILLMTGVYSEEDLKIASKYDFDLVVHNSEQFDLIKRNNFYKNLCLLQKKDKDLILSYIKSGIFKHNHFPRGKYLYAFFIVGTIKSS